MRLNISPIADAVNFDQKDEIERFARRFNPEISAEKISDCFKMLRWMEANVNERLIFEHLLLSLADSDRIQV
jgi:hypothetical protein